MIDGRGTLNRRQRSVIGMHINPIRLAGSVSPHPSRDSEFSTGMRNATAFCDFFRHTIFYL